MKKVFVALIVLASAGVAHAKPFSQGKYKAVSCEKTCSLAPEAEDSAKARNLLCQGLKKGDTLIVKRKGRAFYIHAGPHKVKDVRYQRAMTYFPGRHRDTLSDVFLGRHLTGSNDTYELKNGSLLRRVSVNNSSGRETRVTKVTQQDDGSISWEVTGKTSDQNLSKNFHEVCRFVKK